MKINFLQTMKDLDGKNSQDENKDDISCGKVAIRALMLSISDGRQNSNISADQKFKQYKLAMLIDKSMDDNTDAEFTIEDVALIKKVVGEFYNPLIVGQMYDLLENSKG